MLRKTTLVKKDFVLKRATGSPNKRYSLLTCSRLNVANL